MNADDRIKFSQLLSMLGEIYGKQISDSFVDFYFEALKDLEYDELHRNAIDYVNTAGKNRYPVPGDLRGDSEKEALEAYTIIREMLNRFYSPELHGITLNIIKEKLEKMGRPDLFPMLQNWGEEILYEQNPTATRAQFIRAYRAERKIVRKALPAKENKEPKILAEFLSLQGVN